MPEPQSLTVTILVPALNEESTIREVVERLLALPISTQVIVIDDASSDLTGEILESFGEKISVITHPIRKGKGSAIRSGLTLASGDVVIIQDADLEYAPEQIPDLIAAFTDPSVRGVYGTRFKNGLPAAMALPNKIINRILALMVRLLYRQPISDEATCYKAIRTDDLRAMNLECTGFEFCPEVTAKLSRMGHRIIEIPIRYEPRNKLAGKKIRWTDAPIAIWTLLKYAFWKSNR